MRKQIFYLNVRYPLRNASTQNLQTSLGYAFSALNNIAPLNVAILLISRCLICSCLSSLHFAGLKAHAIILGYIECSARICGVIGYGVFYVFKLFENVKLEMIYKRSGIINLQLTCFVPFFGVVLVTKFHILTKKDRLQILVRRPDSFVSFLVNVYVQVSRVSHRHVCIMLLLKPPC